MAHPAIAKMTLDEKLLMLGGQDNWHFYGVERLGIPAIRTCDGPHGIRVHTDRPDGSCDPATNFPCASALAATFNPELLKEVGETIAKECRHYGIQVLLGPGVNGKRSPLAGRNFEYYSEDPYLSGTMATSFIQGLQHHKVGTSIKHFIANEQETSRLFISSNVDERTLHEIYLTPFEMAIKHANPWTVMASYNRINGTYGCENTHTLMELLKTKLGYDGLVVSDWGAVNDKVDSVKYGLDIQMPGPVELDLRLKAAVESGDIPMSVIDEHVERILRLGERVYQRDERYPTLDLEAHHTVAQKTAAETLVLLKNDGILPLKKNTTIAVIGRFADDQVRYNGGGSSWLNAYRVERPLDALKTKAKVLYAKGYDQEKVTKASTLEAVEVAKKAKTVLFFTGTTSSMESEGFDRANIDLPVAHRKLLAAVAKVNPNVVVILNNGAAVDLRSTEPLARAILEAWLLGSAAGQPIADVLFGDINPSGKLSETFPLRLEHTPAYGNFPGQTDHVDYTEGILVGYRHYDTRKLEVMYPFGHGLSYTTFKLGPIHLSTTELDAKDTLSVSVTLTNTGKRAGAEVVQLYVQDPQSTLIRPEKELRAFKKVFLEPQATQTVDFTLSERDFAAYVTHLGRYAVESGTFNVLIGFSSRDIRRKATLTVNSTDKVRPHLTLEYPYTQWIRYPQEKVQIEALVKATRPPFWWETEPPLSRWLLILKREFNWSDADEARIKAQLLEEA